jgi:protein-S-isoprenylcysteine O-methyltransferase Ste14
MRRLFVNITTTSFFLAVLLISAGRLNYWQAWVYGGMSLLMNVATLLILRQEPGLARERSKPGAGTKAWDKKLLGLGLMLTLAILVIAGLDSGRNHWIPHLSWKWSIFGMVLNCAGMTLFLLALKENRFFSSVVRIQNDRRQIVCRTGPYGVIRHPGNAGMAIGTIGLPFLFMSIWSAIPMLLSVIIVVIRTHLEDMLLQDELEGYCDYQRSTRFRLIPGIW